MDLQRFFEEALDRPAQAIAHHVSTRLASLFPEKAMLEGLDFDFQLEDFATAGHCQLLLGPAGDAQFSTVWDHEEGAQTTARNAWLEVVWEGKLLDVVLMGWDDGCWRNFWILADSELVAKAFFSAVCAWRPELDGKILVFERGRWSRTKQLFDELRTARLENLILPSALKQQIVSDLEQFFAARETYKRYGLCWKRGILFVGPPGNGKTHAVKALVQALGRPCLYVKSFADERWLDQTNIGRVFEKARSLAPCLLVLEDLDSLIERDSRAYFLNELDGFASNDGLAVLGTSNHPEKLDPALRDRPSRFDRTFRFDAPKKPERLSYLRMWNSALNPDMHLSDDELARLARRTKGFSFAYLKELVASSMAAWLAEAKPGGMYRVMKAQAVALKDQCGATDARAPVRASANA